MKQLQLDLKERLLIVEYETEAECAVECALMHAFKNPNIVNHGHKVKPICNGSDLTEEIAKGFLHQSIHTGLFAHYVKDIPVNTYCYKTALEAFGAVIYAYGYHWGENPVKKPVVLVQNLNYQQKCDFKNRMERFNYNESRTFNPSKCIIFEIV